MKLKTTTANNRTITNSLTQMEYIETKF